MDSDSELRDISVQLMDEGMAANQARAKQALFVRCAQSLGGREIDSAAFVPGRIEFLGKHTDYCGGRSLLCAVDRGLIVAAVPRDDRDIRITETSSGEQVVFAPTAELQPRTEHWSNYPMTVVRRMVRNFGNLRGADIAIASDLPRAAGLSSSSALVVAMYMVLLELNQLEYRRPYQDNIHAPEDLAGYLGAVENGQGFGTLAGDHGVGTFGGSQDHTAILSAQPGDLVQYRFAPVVEENSVWFPDDYVLAVGVSGVVAEKTGAARDLYNQVSLRAAEILNRWNLATSRHDPTLAAAAGSSLDAPAQISSLVKADVLLAQRFDQFLLESCQIIPAAAESLLLGNFTQLGNLVDRSQRAAENMLHNQVPETIYLAASARSLGAVAASAFGAGFGGSVWAMIPANIADEFLTNWSSAYARQFPLRSSHSQFFLTRPSISATYLQLRSSDDD